MVLRTTFGVEDDRIIGAPLWVDTRRYDIEAKVAPEDAHKLDKLNAEDRVRADTAPATTKVLFPTLRATPERWLRMRITRGLPRPSPSRPFQN